VQALGHLAIAPLASPPGDGTARGRTVCVCHGVGEAEIATRFAAGAALAEVQAALKCGTGCGSCLPEVRRMQAAAAIASCAREAA
jgi:assimilatory nitrate reductase catalytic subunit